MFSVLIISLSLEDMIWGSRRLLTRETTATLSVARLSLEVVTNFTQATSNSWFCFLPLHLAYHPRLQLSPRARSSTWRVQAMEAHLLQRSSGTRTVPSRAWRLSTSLAETDQRPQALCWPWCQGRMTMDPLTGVLFGTEPYPRLEWWKHPPKSMSIVSIHLWFIFTKLFYIFGKMF